DHKGDYEAASASFRRAVANDPNNGISHSNLGRALYGLGQLSEAREAWLRAADRFPPNHPARAAAVSEARPCERLLQLAERPPRLRRGEDQPGSAAEGLECAALCRLRRRHAAAVRFFASAFAADPRLADDLSAAHRYNAAASAALAAAGRGADSGGLDGNGRAL